MRNKGMRRRFLYNLDNLDNIYFKLTVVEAEGYVIDYGL